jgi:uncharacterized membrane protein YidH (DUF202 family)
VRVELTHDVLTGVVRDSRKERRLREDEEKAKASQREAEAQLLSERAEAQKKLADQRQKLADQRRLLTWMAAAAIIVAGIAIYAWVQEDRARRAERKAQDQQQATQATLDELRKR